MNVTPEDGISVTDSVIVLDVDAVALPIGARWDADAQEWIAPEPESTPGVVDPEPEPASPGE